MAQTKLTFSVPKAVLTLNDDLKARLQRAFKTTLASELSTADAGDDVSISIENNPTRPPRPGYGKKGSKAKKGSAKTGAAKKKVSKKK